MGKKWLLVASSLLVAGCAQFPDLHHVLGTLSPRATTAPAGLAQAKPTHGDFNFDWALSGSQSVAPLQVFDNGHQTWLQFAPGSPVPAVFARSAVGARGATFGNADRLLVPNRQGDFVVLDEVPSELIFRGGHLQAQALRTVPNIPQAVPVKGPDPIIPIGPSAADMPAQISMRDKSVAVPDQVMATETFTEPVQAVELPVAPRFSVSRDDGTLRQALSRWATQSGWDFGPEHWMVEVDIPIIGAASFDLPFIAAVQSLVASTELAERPLQPCFYSNQVLRVVPYAQACDRVRHVGVSS